MGVATVAPRAAPRTGGVHLLNVGGEVVEDDDPRLGPLGLLGVRLTAVLQDTLLGTRRELR
jgi:hypothetical protein